MIVIRIGGLQNKRKKQILFLLFLLMFCILMLEFGQMIMLQEGTIKTLLPVNHSNQTTLDHTEPLIGEQYWQQTLMILSD